MAAEIKNEFGIICQLVPGARGIFDVMADGKRIYSKHETGRFPEKLEINRLLKPK